MRIGERDVCAADFVSGVAVAAAARFSFSLILSFADGISAI